jgi:O-methyltransferase
MKAIIKCIFDYFGYDIKLIEKKKYIPFKLNGYNYSVIKSSSDYSPWLGDEDFLKLYSQINNNTLVDLLRCFELWELAEHSHQLNKNAALIEVGVWRGGTAAVIGKKLSSLNSTVNFYLADTFTGVAKASIEDAFYTGGEHADTDVNFVSKFLSPFYENYKILQGVFPNDTANLISGEEVFSFCHVDVDVYESAKDIVEWIWNRLIIGGVIVFDDYGFHTCNGITKFVNTQKKLKDRIVLHNINGHAVIVKLF